MVFVLTPALLLECFVANDKVKLSGLIYLGVGMGFLISGFLVEHSSLQFKSEKRWFPLAILSLLLMIYSVVQYIKIRTPIPVGNKNQKNQNQKLFERKTRALFLAYAGAGLGYIIPMTFLPTLVHEILPGEIISASDVWIVISISCVLFTPFWNWMGNYFNDRISLIFSYCVQSIGVGLLAIYPSILGIIVCAILIGGSFLASVMCTQRLARFFLPTQGPKISALLITIYAGSQLVGPWISKLWIQNGGSLLQCFSISLAAFLWGVFWSVKIPDFNVLYKNE